MNEFSRSAKNTDEMNLAYYEANARNYADITQSAKISSLHDKFLINLPHKAKMLDVGCGSGRDLKVFKDRGLFAIGLEPSHALAEIARNHSGCEVTVEKIENIKFTNAFDGVWACASLLHLPKQKFPLAIQKIYECLHAHGYFFLSMQAGFGESTSIDGRFYSRYEETELVDVLRKSGFFIQSTWRTTDSLAGRASLQWINIVAHK